MKIKEETGLPGLPEYLRMLAKGIRDEGVYVNVRYYPSPKSTNWHGWASGSHITIDIGRAVAFPYSIIDRYMVQQKRLADLRANPRVASNPQELIGFLFIHELHHIKEFRADHKAVYSGVKRSRVGREAKCTRWAYDHWQPMPKEMIEAGMRRALDNYAEAIKRAQDRAFREAARGSPAAKLEVLQSRLKRLDTRMKRLATSRKKLERRIAYYRRQVVVTVQEQTVAERDEFSRTATEFQRQVSQ